MRIAQLYCVASTVLSPLLPYPRSSSLAPNKITNHTKNTPQTTTHQNVKYPHPYTETQPQHTETERTPGHNGETRSTPGKGPTEPWNPTGGRKTEKDAFSGGIGPTGPGGVPGRRGGGLNGSSHYTSFI